MIDKKEPVEPSNLDAAPVLEEDRTGPDNALKHPPELDSDAHDDAGLHRHSFVSHVAVGLHDKLQHPPELDSDAHDDAGLHDKLQSLMEQDSDAQVHDKLQSPVEQDSGARDDVGLHDAHIDVVLQDKLQSPAEQEPNWMKRLTPEVRMRVQRLQEFQDLHNELEKKLFEEQKALGNKYEDSFKSLYNKRSKIVNGEVDVESNTYETAEEAASDEKATKVKGIPDFWLTVMKKNETLASMITSRDEEALKYLKDIKYCTIGDPLNLKLDFFFDTNPFFTNSILTRTYKEIENHQEIACAQSTGTKINWFPKKSLTHEITKYKQKGRRKRKTRTKELVSFFSFFGDSDDGIGHIFYNKIIPKAVSWYTGEALLEETETEIETETESSAQEDSDETGSSEEEEEFDEYEDDNESDGEASKKRTRVEGLTARKSRLIR